MCTGGCAKRCDPEMHLVDGVPPSAKNASFMWERGTKLQYTDPSPVNSDTGVVYWGNTLLKQVATRHAS